MSHDNKSNEENGFSFIQEQIIPSRKSKWKKMLFSLIWTIVLASVFGLVAVVVFTVAGPSIDSILGKAQDKKTVEFPINEQEDGDNTEPGTSNPDNGEGTGQQKEDENQSDTVFIENTIKADIEDLNTMYAELRAVANGLNTSMVTVTTTINGVDWFENEYEAAKISTGLIVANNEQDLLILVNRDQIKDAKEIRVTFYNSLQVKARLQIADSDLNLAVIAVSLEDIPKSNLIEIKPATLGESYSVIPGMPIIALGSPNGYAGSMEFGTITAKGVVAYITDNKIDLFTTDINDNDNGSGVIINLQGEVIGIITQTLPDEQNQSVSTVIGISRIKKIIEKMVNNEPIVYFGIHAIDMTLQSLATAKVDNGISVTKVEADSPALKAGIQSGDIILSVNGNTISSMNSFNTILSLYEPKSELEVTIRRNGQSESKDIKITVTLGKKN